MPNINMIRPFPVQHWQNAISEIPKGRPMFALVLVIATRENDESWLECTLQSEVSIVIDHWAKQYGWQHYPVGDADVTSPATSEAIFVNDAMSQSITSHSDTPTPVYVFRHVLTPTDSLAEDNIQAHLKQLSFEEMLPPHQFDCHILPIAKVIRPHKLAFFDMDSTLIEQEVIVELAKKAGIGDKVSAITESAMRGEIDFSESFTKRVALLKGLPTTVLDDICKQLTLSSGAKILLASLKAQGYHTVLVSGGFTYFAHHVADQLGIDEVYANELDIKDDVVTGEVVLPIVDGNRKAHIVQEVASRLNIPLSQVICVGDGANDLAMMAVADLGIAYRAKPVVQAQADTAINATGLDGVLHCVC